MENLSDKIYNAINEGIHKALVLPDEQADDISVKYAKKKISNQIKNPINNMVKKIIDNKNDSELVSYIYDRIIKYHDELDFFYEVKTIDEINTIFNILNKIRDHSINWIDFGNLITFILKNGQEIKICDYNSNDNVIFIKINLDKPVILLIDGYRYSKKLKWEIEENPNYLNTEGIVYEEQLINDKDGWKHTYHNDNIQSIQNDMKYYISTTHSDMPFIYNNQNVFSNYPALHYIDKLADRLGMHEYKAYLPAFGEIYMLGNYLKIINHITYTYFGIYAIPYCDGLLTSTEKNDEIIYTVYIDTVTKNYQFCNTYKEITKHTSCNILPFFKKIS